MSELNLVDPHDFWHGGEDVTLTGSALPPESGGQRRTVVTWTPPRARAAGLPFVLGRDEVREMMQPGHHQAVPAEPMPGATMWANET